LGWYAHFLPPWLLKVSTFATLIIEIVFPFFIFLGRRMRLLAFFGFVVLELLIVATGSYNFFNLLTIVLCVCLVDDRDLEKLRPLFAISARERLRYVVSGLAAVIAVGGVLQVVQTVVPQYAFPGSRHVLGVLHVPRIVNPYGLFAVMTTQRNEIVWQGSMDGTTWHTYEFPYKPGNPGNAPVIATPHQPRLDWQMWFAALGTTRQAPWAYEFAGSLLRAEASVLGLIVDPLEGKSPRYVRAQLYRYEFSTPEQRASSKNWWIRSYRGEWLPPVRMRTPVISHEPLVIDDS
ncbi:MAG: lipase maturation factor family protein, partial [Gammaproteobacteria bacterium]|nr:lipase maturation factor family protein [Gammaproteobacteria bacterium]